jgi:uncharacterized pyridoxamine 5'-phosphate oxidase family protein
MEPTVVKVWVDDTKIYVQTEDGKIYSQKFARYYRLRHATPEQRANFTTSRFGIHWEELDEDLSLSGFITEKPENEIYKAFKAHPEISISSVARRMSIPQSLLAGYIGGIKKPSKERRVQIEKTLHEIGTSLQEVKIA